MNCPRELRNVLIDTAIGDGSNDFRGCKWGEQTRFAVLDIDAASEYHNALALQNIRQMLEGASLKATLYQSSNSGGWHLYLFLDNWENSDEVAQLLSAFCKAHGLTIAQGTLEIFPSNQGLRLPLQRGFAWLDRGIKREDVNTNQALSLFLEDLETSASSWPLAKAVIESQLRQIEQERGEAGTDSGSNLIAENYEQGRRFWSEGLQERGQRHHAVMCVEHYLWHGDEQAGLPPLKGFRFDAQRQRLIKEWLENNHNGCCSHINRGDWRTVDKQIERACTWRRDKPKTRESYPITERMIDRMVQTGLDRDDLIKANLKRENSAIQRISAAVKRLRASGQYVGVLSVSRESGASVNTVRKHRHLLAKGSGVLNRGVQGGFSVLHGSGAGSERSEQEKEVLEPSDDSGKNAEIDASISDGCSPVPQIEINAQGIGVLPACSRVFGRNWRRRGIETAEAIKIYASPLLRGEPNTRIKQTVCTCGLNGCPPASGSPPFNPRKFVRIGLRLGPIRRGESCNRRSGRKESARAPPQIDMTAMIEGLSVIEGLRLRLSRPEGARLTMSKAG